MGPSGPAGKPLATAMIHDTNFTAYAFRENIFSTYVPLRYAISSGRPEPAAAGHITCELYHMFQNNLQNKYPVSSCSLLYLYGYGADKYKQNWNEDL